MQAVPLSQTVMPAVQPGPPEPPEEKPQPRRALGQVGYGPKAIDRVLGGAAQPGDMAISVSDPNVSYTALGNGMVEKRNTKFGTVSYQAVGGSLGSNSSRALGGGLSRNTFPSAPTSGGYGSNPSYSGRSMEEMERMSPKAARDISKGRAGLF